MLSLKLNFFHLCLFVWSTFNIYSTVIMVSDADVSEHDVSMKEDVIEISDGSSDLDVTM